MSLGRFVSDVLFYDSGTPCKFDDCQFRKFRSIYLWARLNGLNFLTLSGELRHAVIAGKQKKEVTLTWTLLLPSQKLGGSDPIFWGKTMGPLHSWVHGWWLGQRGSLVLRAVANREKNWNQEHSKVGASSVHAVRGLICTRGQGTRLYTRNGFAVGNVCKSKVCYHPQPTHPPTQPKGMCVCAYSWEDMQVQGMLPSPPHPPTHPTKVCVCVCVQLGMYASPRYVTIPTPPTHPTQRYVCVCVRTVGNVCKSKVCYHPQPTHPPNPKVCVCVCVCVQLGMYASPRYVTIPTPPTHHPPNPKVCVYRWVPKNTLCVQMSQICVRRWGFWSVCTDESNLCAQMSPLPHSNIRMLLRNCPGSLRQNPKRTNDVMIRWVQIGLPGCPWKILGCEGHKKYLWVPAKQSAQWVCEAADVGGWFATTWLKGYSFTDY